MSKRRAIIVSVVMEGRSQAETARRYGVSESWVSRLLARYRAEGDAAFEPRSRRPHTSPAKTEPATVDLIITIRRELSDQGLDAGPATIRWHLETHHNITVSVSTIRRFLLAGGLIIPEPKKRPKTSYIRFQADLPNELWQTDFTHVAFANGHTSEVLTWLDDHSRYALSVTAHHRITGPIVVDTFLECGSELGFPTAVLSDNAMVYTTRFAGGKSGRNQLETLLANYGIEHKHAAPGHPTTCGKVERFQQTLKQFLHAHPPTETLTDLQHQLDRFVDVYNHHRPHRSLGRVTPTVAYTRLPKTGPKGTTTGPHYRIRHDKVDTTGTVTLRHAGQLHHIGIGRTHTGTPITLLIDDLEIRIIATTTGELLRHLTLNPNHDYQPQHPTT